MSPRFLSCGDLLFNGDTPFLLMGSLRGAIDALTTVVPPIPATVIVPGHSGPCDDLLIDVVTGYLDFVLTTAEQGIDAGLSPLELARDIDLGGTPTGWTASASSGTSTGLTPTSGARPPGRVIAALQDMIAYNDGKPLSCYA